MDGAAELYSTMRKIAQKSVPPENMADIVYGTVQSITPLRVTIENKFTIEENQLILSRSCKRATVTAEQITQATHTHNASQGSISGATASITEVELWRGLQEGDSVIMLRVSQGQTYYVLERVNN